MSSTHTFTILVTDSLGATDSQLMTVNLSGAASNGSSILQGFTANFENEGECCGNPVGTNDNWRILRDHVGIHFYASGALPPPASEAIEGRGYVDLATGVYAVYNGGNWVTYPAKAGLLAQDVSTGKLYYNTGSAWVQVVGSAPTGTVTPTNVATVANLLSPSTSTGNFVTDDVLRTTLGTGQDRYIEVHRNGRAAAFLSLNSADNALSGYAQGAGGGSAVYGQAEGTGSGNGVTGIVTGSGGGSGTYGLVTGNGSGSGLLGEVAGSGPGHGVLGRVGFASTATGNVNSAGYFESGSVGTRLATVRAMVLNATTTSFGIWTNNSIFAAGSVTTSDKRLKREIKTIDGELAYKMLQSINFTHYKKLIDAQEVEQRFAELKEQGKAELEALKAQPESVERKKRIDAITSLLAQKVDTSDGAMFLTRQAGIIAQELQLLTKKLKAFDWLVKLSDPSDKDSKLVIDTESLQFILFAGQQYFNKKLEAFMAAQIADGK